LRNELSKEQNTEEFFCLKNLKMKVVKSCQSYPIMKILVQKKREKMTNKTLLLTDHFITPGGKL